MSKVKYIKVVVDIIKGKIKYSDIRSCLKLYNTFQDAKELKPKAVTELLSVTTDDIKTMIHISNTYTNLPDVNISQIIAIFNLIMTAAKKLNLSSNIVSFCENIVNSLNKLV